jgi:hypothetical protein
VNHPRTLGRVCPCPVNRLAVLLFFAVASCKNEPPLARAAAVQGIPPSAVAPNATPPTSAAETAPSLPAGQTATVASAPSAVPTAPPDVPVDVVNIGLHIGGGPNDDVTKTPILRSVEPHFAALRACFAKADEPKKGDFGVDLLIEREGGLAKVTHPRTGIAGDAFRTCVVDVFEKVNFQKPRGGKTMASYSLRFSPRS